MSHSILIKVSLDRCLWLVIVGQSRHTTPWKEGRA